jgi:cytoskeletal protein RodZ
MVFTDEELKESFGDYLRRHREASGKTLDGISRTTRIAKRHLQAFEENDSKNLPGDAFARGFLKAYAKEVGLDSDDCLVRYDRFHRANMPTQIKEIRKPVKVGSFTDGFEPLKNQTWVIRLLGVLVIVAGLVVGAVYLIQTVTKAPVSEPKAELSEEKIENIAEAPPAELAESKVEQKTAPTHGHETAKPLDQIANIPTPVKPSILSVRAVRDAKLSIRVDESAVQEIVLKPEETQTVNVFKEVEIRTMDRAALRFLYNGKPLDISGPVIKLFNRNLFSKKP